MRRAWHTPRWHRAAAADAGWAPTSSAAVTTATTTPHPPRRAGQRGGTPVHGAHHALHRPLRLARHRQPRDARAGRPAEPGGAERFPAGQRGDHALRQWSPARDGGDFSLRCGRDNRPRNGGRAVAAAGELTRAPAAGCSQRAGAFEALLRAAPRASDLEVVVGSLAARRNTNISTIRHRRSAAAQQANSPTAWWST